MRPYPTPLGRFPLFFAMSTLLHSPLPAAPIYLGTYGNAIQSVDFDSASGRFGTLHEVATLARASFLARSPDGRCLYAVGEAKGGVLAAFSIGTDGALTALNSSPSVGDGPCDISVSPDGRLVAAANYSGGSVIVYHRAADGSLGEQAAFFQHTHASNAHADRQKVPHAHGVTWSPDGRLLLVPDLGGDRVYLYARDLATGTLATNPAQPWMETAPASGPRHAQFSPDGRHLYIINELDNTLAVAGYDAVAGTLTLIEAVSTLPTGGFAGATKTAEVVVHPNGRTVYASNRGYDTLALFSRDAVSGKLTPRGHVPMPAHPRHFALSPDAHWLLAAGMDANRVEVFAVSPDTDDLTPTKEHIETTKPVCVRF
jgi:6-phosphogluconolactonase